MTNARNAKATREKAAQLRAEAAKAEARSRNRMIIAAVAALAAVLVAGGVLIKLAKDDADAKSAAASVPPANLVENGYLLGNTAAGKTLELYEDFQCPACKQGEEANATQIEGWAKDGTLKVIYKPVAILDRFSSTDYSTRSANAAYVVISTKPSAYPAFHKLLFDNQPAENTPGLTDDQLIDLAVKAGADKAAVEDDIRKLRYKSWVAKATDAFSKAGYNSTPTYVVDGKQLKDYAPATLAAAVKPASK